jgi:hypothetical protein
MSKFTIIKNRLTSGELSEKLKHRIESQEWQQGVARLDNFIPMQHGGVRYRAGLELAYSLTGNSIGNGCIIPFIVEKETTFLIYLQLSPYARLYVYDVNDGSFGAIDTVTNLLTFNIDRRLDPNGFRYAQINDVLVLTHISSSMCPILIYRNEVGDFYYNYWKDVAGFFESSTINKQLLVPYTPKNFNGDFLLKPAATSGSTTLTAYGSGGISTINIFTARYIGKWYRIIHGAVEGSFFVTDVTAIRSSVTSIDFSTNILTLVAHGLSTGVALYFRGQTEFDLPKELASVEVCTNPYYVIKVTDDTFKLAYTYEDAVAGIAIDLTSNGGSGTLYFYKATSYSSVVQGVVSETLGGTTVTDNWRESAWDSDRGFPKLVTFFQRRSYFFSTLIDRDYVFASLLDNIFHMMGPYFIQDINGDSDEVAEVDRTAPADITGNNYFNYTSQNNVKAFSFGLGGGEAGDIQWCRSNSSFLQVGTISAEHILTATDGIVGEVNIYNKIQTNEGGSSVNALGINNVTLYINRNGKSLREFVYNDANGSFISNDVSFLSDQIIKHQFDGLASSSYNDIQFTYMQSQQEKSCLWLTTTEKALVGIVYDYLKQMRAWFRITLGGVAAKVESIAVIPSSGGKRDSLYAVISRTVNGGTVYTLERMVQDFEHPVLANSSEGDMCYYFDGGFTKVLSAATNTITGLGHLEGETLGVLVNGLAHSNVQVTGGSVILASTYPIGTVISLGLLYTGRVEFFPIEAGGDFGQATGLVKRVDRLMIGLWKTLGLKVSSDDIKYEDCDEIDGYPYTSVTSAFTGDIIKYYDGDNEINERLYLKQDRPYPCYITSVFYRGVTHD